MYKVRVCAYRVDLHTHGLKLFVLFSHIDQFGRTNKSEVGRIEEEDSPFTLYIFVGYCFELTVLKCLYTEFRKLRIDNCLHNLYF